MILSKLINKKTAATEYAIFIERVKLAYLNAISKRNGKQKFLS